MLICKLQCIIYSYNYTKIPYYLQNVTFYEPVPVECAEYLCSDLHPVAVVPPSSQIYEGMQAYHYEEIRLPSDYATLRRDLNNVIEVRSSQHVDGSIQLQTIADDK